MTRPSRIIAAIGLAAGLVAGGLPAGAAPPTTLALDIAGVYDRHGDVDTRVWRQHGRIQIRTVGFEGAGTVECANQACRDRGLDATRVDVLRDMEIVLDFKGSDEELAVRGRSSGRIFTDGFESGDLSAVRGTATCGPPTQGNRVCSVDLQLRGRLKGPDLAGRITLTMVGDLILGGGAASWGVVDWTGSLEAR